MQKINVIIFVQVIILHTYSMVSIYIYIEEVVEQAATKHDHESQLPLDSTLVHSNL